MSAEKSMELKTKKRREKATKPKANYLVNKLINLLPA